jgi:hypothetical protein
MRNALPELDKIMPEAPLRRDVAAALVLTALWTISHSCGVMLRQGSRFGE